MTIKEGRVSVRAKIAYDWVRVSSMAEVTVRVRV